MARMLADSARRGRRARYPPCEEARLNRRTLADRTVVYSDTVVVFALVNGFAFLISLADPDIRCSIRAVAEVTWVANVVMPIVVTWALFWLRGYEMRLRAPVDPDDEEDESPTIGDPLVARFRSRLFSVRLVLIWVFSGIVIVGIYGATLDPSCNLVTGGAR